MTTDSTRIQPRRSSVETGVLSMLLLASVAAFMFGIPRVETLEAGVSQTWVTIVFVALWVALLLAAIRAARGSRRSANAPVWSEIEPRGWIPIALTLAYVLLIPIVGFNVGTLLGTGALFLALGVKPVVAIAQAVGLTMLLTVVFTALLYMPLPRGVGPFEQLSITVFSLLSF